MPKQRECDYCGADIEPGTGTMLVRVNGNTVDFCSSKCEKNADLGREAREQNWTAAGRESDRQTTVSAEREAEEEAAEADADAEADSEAAPDLEAVEDEADADAEDEADADADAEDESSEDDDQAEEAEA